MRSLKTFSIMALVGSLALAVTVPANAECWYGPNNHVFCRGYSTNYGAQNWGRRDSATGVLVGGILGLAVGAALAHNSQTQNNPPQQATNVSQACQAAMNSGDNGRVQQYCN